MIEPTWDIIAACDTRIAALDVLVQRVAKSVAADESRWCANAFFSTAVKPFLLELVGNGRGYPPECANDPTKMREPIVWEEAFAAQDDRIPATTPFEEMLRTSEAYDLVYDRLYLPLPGCRDCSCL
ncbi:hypothetical protein ACQP2T_13575 [Nonomuraea sp. CA-143628]|uniref:hypothetical protein n=1 Tax=Nonomuraea sp. CA-143628 TaxID=3239997 RepID=UPI003D8A16A1